MKFSLDSFILQDGPVLHNDHIRSEVNYCCAVGNLSPPLAAEYVVLVERRWRASPPDLAASVSLPPFQTCYCEHVSVPEISSGGK